MRDLLGVLLAGILAVSAAILFSNYQTQSNLNQQIATTAGQAVQFNTAVQSYITQYATNISAVATATAPVTITVPMLQASTVNLLPGSFSSTNPFGQTWQAEVLQPTPGTLQALALGVGGTALSDKVASSVAALIGAAGGFIPKNDSGTWPAGAATAQGAYAGWSVSTAGYTGIAGGNIASLLTYSNGQFVSNYLYRNNVGNTSLNTMNTPLVMASTQTLGSPCSNTGAIAQDGTGQILSCQAGVWTKAVGSPKLHRYVFTQSSSWTVPSGATAAFVTMAGGGGSGLGWRVSNAFITGSSGGYVFSQPVTLVAGETIQVNVGKGGVAYAPYNSGIQADPGHPYYVYTNPSGDDGLGGYPGGLSSLVSPSLGTLLECDGGSGATAGGIDNYSGSLVAGNLNGATFGSGKPPYSAPSRPASGPYVSSGGPGACGPSNYGVGNVGMSSWQVSSGNYPGGETPFGYGSGGAVYITGCHVTTSTVGLCVFPQPGRDGVVFIDVLY